MLRSRRQDNGVSVVDVELEKSMNIQRRKSHRQTHGQGWRGEDPLEGRPKEEVSSLEAVIKLWLASRKAVICKPFKGKLSFFLWIPIPSSCPRAWGQVKAP